MLSTGVIGVLPPKPNIAKGLEKIQLSPQNCSLGTFTNGAANFSRAILTTDTTTKTSTYRLELDGKEVCITGCAKGSGMIHPNMATMLAFITTDAAVAPVFLQELLRNSTERSFHRISVDGDCSTNDSVLIFANGLAKNRPITPEHPEWQKFQRALERLCQDLAKAIVRDGEGATKFIEIEVCGAPTERDAALCALAKAAGAASTAGNSGVDVARMSIFLGKGRVCLFASGKPQRFSKEQAAKLLSHAEIHIGLDLQQGLSRAVAWGSDLSTEYVEINAHKRS